MARSGRSIGLFGILWRIVAPLVLVLITYNPTGTSFYHWFSGAIGSGDLGAVHFLALVVLLIGWSILLVATWNSLDTFGVILVLALFGTLVWVLIEWGVLAANSRGAVTWISLVCISAVLTVGLSWAHVWRRLTGQVAVDEMDD